MSRFALGSAALIALAGVALLGGCADPAGSSVEVGKLQEQVGELATRAEKLEQTVETQRRQIAGLKDDIISIRSDQQELLAGAIEAEAEVAAGGSSETGGMAAESGDAGLASPGALEEALASEAGQKAIELHIKKANERRDKERWGRMVDGMVDRFADQANLTDDQVGQMKDIMSKGTDQMREIWTGLRGDGGEEISREERAVRMEEARTKSQEIRDAMDLDVKAALSAEQYDQYKEMSDRMGRFMGGGGGRRGGGGGR